MEKGLRTKGEEGGRVMPELFGESNEKDWRLNISIEFPKGNKLKEKKIETKLVAPSIWRR